MNYDLTSVNALHSSRICFIVSSVLQSAHVGGFSPAIRWEWVNLVCPMRILHNTISSLLPSCWNWVCFPTNGIISYSLLSVLESHLVCQRPCMYVSRRKLFIIYSDSLSCLQAIGNEDMDNPFIQKILVTHTEWTQDGKHVTLCWIPSHIGIDGNEEADKAAKDSLSEPIRP